MVNKHISQTFGIGGGGGGLGPLVTLLGLVFPHLGGGFIFFFIFTITWGNDPI